MTDLRNYLAFVSDSRRNLAGLPKRFAYGCLEDFVLQHGEDWTHAPRPKGVRQRTPNHCFENALHLVDSAQGERLGLRYVEGYATSVIPLLHAWTVTPDGTVIDPTWPDRLLSGEGRAYFGVAFPLEVVQAAIYLKRTYGVLEDWQNDYPLLQRPYDPVKTLRRLRTLTRKKSERSSHDR